MIDKNLHAVFDLEYHLVIVTKYRHYDIPIDCLKVTSIVRC